MPAARRALTVLPVAALAVAATPAQAAPTIKTMPCVPYVEGESIRIPIFADGFTPGSLVRVYTNTGTTPPLLLMSAPADARGGFGTEAAPPLPWPLDRNVQTFNLFGADRSNPAAPIVAASQFRIVRFGLTSKPAYPKRPGQIVTYTARGFRVGAPVYIHFRFGGKTRRSVRLGVARGPCGIVSKRMRMLPTRARYGNWTMYTNQRKRFSRSTRPAWQSSFTIFRRFR
ncbi:MAG TPA: hypothetical protein VGR11_03630 [Solirubrobacteraceae bacterium]|nr:hypothetical protein [Solirubrobacteraceae bacterium]